MKRKTVLYLALAVFMVGAPLVFMGTTSRAAASDSSSCQAKIEAIVAACAAKYGNATYSYSICLAHHLGSTFSCSD